MKATRTFKDWLLRLQQNSFFLDQHQLIRDNKDDDLES